MVRRRSSPMGESKLGDARQQPADAQHDRRCTAWPRHDSSCEIGVISAEKTRRVGAATMTTTILADGRHGTFHFDVDDAALAIGSGDGAEAASWRRWWFVVVDGADFIHGPPAAAPWLKLRPQRLQGPAAERHKPTPPSKMAAACQRPLFSVYFQPITLLCRRSSCQTVLSTNQRASTELNAQDGLTRWTSLAVSTGLFPPSPSELIRVLRWPSLPWDLDMVPSGNFSRSQPAEPVWASGMSDSSKATLPGVAVDFLCWFAGDSEDSQTVYGFSMYRLRGPFFRAICRRTWRWTSWAARRGLSKRCRRVDAIEVSGDCVASA